MQPDVLAGSHLGDLVDVAIGDHADHWITSGDRMVGTKYHR